MKGQASLELLVVFAAVLSITLILLQPINNLKISEKTSLTDTAYCDTAYLIGPQLQLSFNPIDGVYSECLSPSVTVGKKLRVTGERKWL